MSPLSSTSLPRRPCCSLSPRHRRRSSSSKEKSKQDCTHRSTGLSEAAVIDRRVSIRRLLPCWWRLLFRTCFHSAILMVDDVPKGRSGKLWQIWSGFSRLLCGKRQKMLGGVEKKWRLFIWKGIMGNRLLIPNCRSECNKSWIKKPVQHTGNRYYSLVSQYIQTMRRAISSRSRDASPLTET